MLGHGPQGLKGQVWTRHEAPAAPASRPSLPSQFHRCSCLSASSIQFRSLTSRNRVRAGGRLLGSGHYRLSTGLRWERSGLSVFHFRFHFTAGMCAIAGPVRPHTAVSVIPAGRSKVNRAGHCHRPRGGRGGWIRQSTFGAVACDLALVPQAYNMAPPPRLVLELGGLGLTALPHTVPVQQTMDPDPLLV